MATRIIAAADGMAEAVERLRAGKLVAFPSETVYGLGANALDAEAVTQIFAAKGRPATNPLIVHVADTIAAQALCADWTPLAAELAAMYWAGAVTLVVKKADAVPDIVTAGGGTVALRVPDHPVALELLTRSGVPVAAPSANRSEGVSPTTAQHVADSLGAFVDDLLILDGGACAVGIESTVVDATGETARVLRPGMVSVVYAPANALDGDTGVARSPGQMARHYAPRTPTYVLTAKLIRKQKRDGDGIIARAVMGAPPAPVEPNVLLLPADPHGYAAALYAALHAIDSSGVARILIEEPPHGGRWDAIRDRLARAVAPRLDT
ncbi:MAG: threonylcarbamoyl-AMP synthase [Armatimonadetes bacterium]|nr:threonylcarbamoyl-AMP synthase [Armatimonadota bacterium]